MTRHPASVLLGLAAAAPSVSAFVAAGCGGVVASRERGLALSGGSGRPSHRRQHSRLAVLMARSGRSKEQGAYLSTDPEDMPIVLPPPPPAGGARAKETPGEFGDDELVDMVVKLQGDPEEILRKLKEAGLMKSAVLDTVIMHSDKARLQRGTKTLEGKRRVRERSYFGTPLWQLILRRSSVLTVLMFMQSLSSLVLTQYEELIQANVFLALFLTMLTGTGGNAGNQSASMVIRGMSTGEINDSTMLRAIGRELLASSAIGALLAAAAFGRVLITPGTDSTCASVIALCSFITPPCTDGVVVSRWLSMRLLLHICRHACWKALTPNRLHACNATPHACEILQVVLAISGGTLVPLIVERMGGDPAVTSSPVLATLTDIIGVIVLCVISSKMLADVL